MDLSKQSSSNIPPASKGSWSGFLKSIASFNGDLSSLTAPPFILSSTSLTEYSAYWAEHPSLFVAAAREPDPEKRALLVLKWFLSTLRQQYCTRSEKLGSEKKPLNPFLGELFLGKWPGDADVGETTLISEQVSHHPPVTAYTIQNEKYGVELQGYNAQKATFSNTIHVKQLGHALLTITPPGADRNDPSQRERYVFSLPALHVESLIYGNPFMELEKSTRIASSTGYIAKVDYSGKGWLSGKRNTFTASLFKEEDGEKNPLYCIDGQWSEAFTIRNARTKEKMDRYSVKDFSTAPFDLAPIEQQDDYESRRAWRDVALAIERGDMDATSIAKSKIEVAQRELRKVERAEGREWERRFFKRVKDNDDSGFLKLARMAQLPVDLDADKTGGIWRFDKPRSINAKPPYHNAGPEGLDISKSENYAQAEQAV